MKIHTVFWPHHFVTQSVVHRRFVHRRNFILTEVVDMRSQHTDQPQLTFLDVNHMGNVIYS